MNPIIFRFLTSETRADFYFPRLFLQLIRCCWTPNTLPFDKMKQNDPQLTYRIAALCFVCQLTCVDSTQVNSLYCFGHCQELIKPDVWQHSTKWNEKKPGKGTCISRLHVLQHAHLKGLQTWGQRSHCCCIVLACHETIGMPVHACHPLLRLPSMLPVCN